MRNGSWPGFPGALRLPGLQVLPVSSQSMRSQAPMLSSLRLSTDERLSKQGSSDLYNRTFRIESGAGTGLLLE